MNILITGASSGMGRACALQLAGEHHKLLLCAPTEEELQPVVEKAMELGAASAKAVPFDFGHNETLEQFVKDCWTVYDGIDLAMLNAGISQRTNVMDTDESMLRKIMEIDYFAPCLLAKYLLPLMVEKGHGQFAVTTSIAGRFGFPLRCGYSSAKHALYGFFETLQAEYYDKGIRVTLVCPGRVQTNISKYALEKGGKLHGKMDPGQANGITADQAADTIIKAVKKQKLEVLVGSKELIMVQIKRFFPNLCAKLARKIKPE